MDFIDLSVLALFFATFLKSSDFRQMDFRFSRNQRSPEEWILDIANLAIQFFGLPFLGVLFVTRLYELSFPSLKGVIHGSFWVSVVLFCITDYAWYWNHRAFHAKTLYWRLHVVHHEPKMLDVFSTSRGTLWSPLVKTYFWLTPLVVFLLDDPRIFLMVSSFGLFIAFWTHTEFNLPRKSILRNILDLFLVQPEDHFFHHSTFESHTNFGNVFNFWDRLHGTWYQPQVSVKELGFDSKLPMWKKMFFPF